MTTTTEPGSPHGKSVLRDLGPLHKELIAFAIGVDDALDAGEPPA
ncbi:hypothetical protein [Nocardioides sp.]|nr:hypothetical protein [Nocardioides sp.]